MMQALEQLERIPRIPLSEYPTPLEALPRLSRELGRPIYIKRDDLIGPGLGGNKTRKLEYLLAEAVRRGCKKVVTFGGLQSNHARLTAAACRKLGLEAHLFYFVKKPPELVGNLLANHLLGARMHFIPLGGGAGGMTLEQTCRLVHAAALARLGRHFFIPVGGHSGLGCLGYVRAMLEIDGQARQQGISSAWLVCAAGSGGTLAGLAAGRRLCGSQLNLVGIDVGRLWRRFPQSISRAAGEACSRLGDEAAFPAGGFRLVENRYVGAQYAVPTPEGQAALKRLACTEGILLDPVYTAKAFAGLLDLLEWGELGRDGPVIFLHTGGFPALFADL